MTKIYLECLEIEHKNYICQFCEWQIVLPLHLLLNIILFSLIRFIPKVLSSLVKSPEGYWNWSKKKTNSLPIYISGIVKIKLYQRDAEVEKKKIRNTHRWLSKLWNQRNSIRNITFDFGWIDKYAKKQEQRLRITNVC